MGKRRSPRQAFHFGVPGQPGYLRVDVPVVRGRHTIPIDRAIEDVKRGKPGQATACADAFCLVRHKDKFPHDVHYAMFTRTRVYVVDKLRNGLPVRCVAYAHDDGPTIAKFDKKGGKQKLLRDGEAIRTITLRPLPAWRPRETGRAKGPHNGKRSQSLPPGARRRFIEAGLALANSAAA